MHATESTVVPGRAEACAEFLGKSIPGASHINHMPSHTWNEVGRWGDSVRANLEAWHSDLKAAIGEGFAIYPEHNLHMLLYAASMDGQGAIAMRAGKDYAKLTGDSFYQVLTLLRFGRFDEVLEVTNRPNAGDPGRALGLRAGLRAAEAGHADFAQLYLGARQEGRRDLDGRCSASTPRRDLLASSPASSKARFSGSSGDLPGAIAAFERAARYAGRAGLRRTGAAAVLGVPLARRRAARGEAVRRGREGLSRRAEGSSAQRLVAARPAAGARGQGKPSAEVDADLAASWSRSDTWIRSSRF